MANARNTNSDKINTHNTHAHKAYAHERYDHDLNSKRKMLAICLTYNLQSYRQVIYKVGTKTYSVYRHHLQRIIALYLGQNKED